MSLIESAPATIPATRAVTFNAAFGDGTVTRSASSCDRPARSANASTGASPAHDTRFASSNTASITPGSWDSCISRMPFSSADLEP